MLTYELVFNKKNGLLLPSPSKIYLKKTFDSSYLKTHARLITKNEITPD